MTTDFRALCVELVEELAAETSLYPSHEREIVTCARAALAEPQPPADGEVGEALKNLLNAIEGWEVEPQPDDPLAIAMDQARAILTRPHPPAAGEVAPQPIPVAERLPEANTKVLAHYFNDLGKGRTICAIWVPAKSRSEDQDLISDDFTEYDEQDDKFYWPEGWYEAIENWDEYESIQVHEGEVIYWQPLPRWPAHALPLPSGEVE